MEFRTDRLVAKSNLQLNDGKISLRKFRLQGEINLLTLQPSNPEDEGFVFYDTLDDERICHVGFTDKRGRMEVTYGTELSFRNKGYMSEALKFVVDWVFNNTTEAELWAIPNGIISESILRKTGFVYYGEVEDSVDSKWFKIERSKKWNL